MARDLPVVLMHHGGWDEMLAVVGPIGVIVAMIVLARRGRPDQDDNREL